MSQLYSSPDGEVGLERTRSRELCSTYADQPQTYYYLPSYASRNRPSLHIALFNMLQFHMLYSNLKLWLDQEHSALTNDLQMPPVVVACWWKVLFGSSEVLGFLNIQEVKQRMVITYCNIVNHTWYTNIRPVDLLSTLPIVPHPHAVFTCRGILGVLIGSRVFGAKEWPTDATRNEWVACWWEVLFGSSSEVLLGWYLEKLMLRPSNARDAVFHLTGWFWGREQESRTSIDSRGINCPDSLIDYFINWSLCSESIPTLFVGYWRYHVDEPVVMKEVISGLAAVVNDVKRVHHTKAIMEKGFILVSMFTVACSHVSNPKRLSFFATI